MTIDHPTSRQSQNWSTRANLHINKYSICFICCYVLTTNRKQNFYLSIDQKNHPRCHWVGRPTCCITPWSCHSFFLHLSARWFQFEVPTCLEMCFKMDLRLRIFSSQNGIYGSRAFLFRGWVFRFPWEFSGFRWRFWFPWVFVVLAWVRGSAVPGNKFSGGRQVSRFPVRCFCFPLHRLRGKVVQEGWKGVFGFCRRDVRQIPLAPLEPSLPPQKSPTAPSSPSSPMITIVTISTHDHQHHHHHHLHPRSPSAPSSPSAPMITIINSITIITIIIITIITITTIITIITTTINTVNTLSPASTTSAWASPLSHYHTSPVIFTTTMTTSIPIPTITTSPTSPTIIAISRN